MTIILIDSCSYTYYRVTATTAWYTKFQQGQRASLNNKEFVQALEKQYLSQLDKISKKYSVPINKMYSIRDCPIKDIWRRKIYKQYKQKRSEKSSSIYGPMIKHLNTVMKKKFKRVIRIDGAEADDIIATFVINKALKKTKTKIVIIGNDNDYNQLGKYKNVEIVRPKKLEVTSVNFKRSTLDVKILTGDKSDEIPPIFKGCGPKTALKLCSKKSLIYNLLHFVPGGSNKEYDVYTNYLRNAELIDFSYIPSDLRLEILRAFKLRSPSRVQLGLCCLNTELRKKGIFCSRKPILRTIETKGFEYLVEQCLKNCSDLIEMIKWNHKHGIKVFRVSSGLFPHFGNDRLSAPIKKLYTLDFAQSLLAKAGRLARKYGQRLTFHPGQYNVVASPTKSSWEKTCIELDMHAEILDRMSCGVDSVIVVHGGGIYGDKEKTKKRWIERFFMLSKRVQRRLVLENCEKCYSVQDCLDISAGCGIPVVFDTHHNDCYKQLHPDESLYAASKYIPKILETWNLRGIKPKFHVSEQCCGGKIGKHSDLIETLPKYLMDIPDKYGQNIDIMIEAKLKEQAIFKLYKKYDVL